MRWSLGPGLTMGPESGKLDSLSLSIRPYLSNVIYRHVRYRFNNRLESRVTVRRNFPPWDSRSSAYVRGKLQFVMSSIGLKPACFLGLNTATSSHMGGGTFSAISRFRRARSGAPMKYTSLYFQLFIIAVSGSLGSFRVEPPRLRP